MSWQGHYRRLLGVLLVWALLPLPFTGIILPPFWLAAVAASALLWLTPERTQRLPDWLLNLLAVLILAVVLAVGGLRYGPLRPLGHLLLLLTAVRVIGVSDRRGFLRVLPAVMLVWVSAVASSTHVTLILYLVASAALLWWTGMRLLLDGQLEAAGKPASAAVGPRLGHVVPAAVVAVILAVPVFLVLPRLRSPWVAAGGGLRAVSGFSASVELSDLGTIRESHELAVVLRRADRGGFVAGWTRLRGTALDLVRSGTWAAHWGDAHPADEENGLVWLRPGVRSLTGTVELTVELFVPERYLFLPEGAVALDCPFPVAVDAGEGVVLRRRPDRRVGYRVWVARQPVPSREEPTAEDTFLPPQDPAVVALARSLTTGIPDSAGRARAIERHLRTAYRYSLRGGVGEMPDPVANFLLERREGHCEFFAGAMVVLLRVLGVPARMVGGYSGGTLDPSGHEVLVRQSNAHSWVETWLGPERGWAVFDPTPPEGVPTLGGLQGLERVRWLWDHIQMFWDRNILTFGTGEQLALVATAAELLTRLEGGLRANPRPWLAAVAVIVAVLAALRWGARLRGRPRTRPLRRGPAATAVARLARRLSVGGVAVPVAATVRWIAREAVARWPAAAAAALELARLAEIELYAPGGGPVSRVEVRRVAAELRRATRAGS